MSNYFIPRYLFKIVDYVNPMPSKYLYIEIEDRNKECDDQKYSFFISLKDMFIFREGKNILIGNKYKEINLTHYEIDQADDNYNKLKCLLNLP